MVRRMMLVLLALCIAPTLGDNCFKLQPSPSAMSPFEPSILSQMVPLYKANLNVNGTGMMIASPGAVPALNDCCPGGYQYHWMRDGALSLTSLQRSRNLTQVTEQYVSSTLKAYAGWVKQMQTSRPTQAHTEPKWNLTTKAPYAGGWCRPQTDGPALRAVALIEYAKSLLPHDKESAEEVYQLVKFDLDWVSSGDHYNISSCDLWEETVSPDLFWNRITMRAGLSAGAKLAETLGDKASAGVYRSQADALLGNPVDQHTTDGMLTECSSHGASASCLQYNKQLDGAVILALVHGGTDTSPEGWQLKPTAVQVARTVQMYTEAFCGAYPVNKQDTNNGVPGVLYGRYLSDEYGGGNPWVLITAALANLIYRAAGQVAIAALADDELSAWKGALGQSFDGSVEGFVAAADGVMTRLRYHTGTGGHLYEQLDKYSGIEYNAEDLTWSFAEVFDAMHQRTLVWDK